VREAFIGLMAIQTLCAWLTFLNFNALVTLSFFVLTPVNLNLLFVFKGMVFQKERRQARLKLVK